MTSPVSIENMLPWHSHWIVVPSISPPIDRLQWRCVQISLNAYRADPERATATSSPFTSNAFAAPSSTSPVAATVMNSAIVPPWVVVSRSLRGTGRRRFCSGIAPSLRFVRPRVNLAPPGPRAPDVGPRQRPVEGGQPDHPFAERDRQQDRHERSDHPCALDEDLVPDEPRTERHQEQQEATGRADPDRPHRRQREPGDPAPCRYAPPDVRRLGQPPRMRQPDRAER